jgi:signal transduction histidine kinase
MRSAPAGWSSVEAMRRIPWTDAVLAAGLAILACAEAIGYADGSRGHLAGSLILVAGAVSLAWRRAVPVPVAVLCSLGLVVPVLLTAPTTETISGAFSLMVAVYSVAAYGPGLPMALIPATVVVAASIVRSLSDWGDLVSVAIGVAMTGAAFVLGLVIRRLQRDTALSVERAVQAERAREEHAAEAVAAERARIARDLHDVVAHAISVIVLQARGGRRMLDIDPAQSRAAFDAVELLAGQAMTDMRRMVGLVRSPDADCDLAPQPSLRHLDALITTLSRPGLRLATDVTGDLAGVPPGVDVAAYRIVQESLTNVVRHADATTASVAVRVTPAGLDIEVVDDGSGSVATPEPGFGMVGMRERVALYHGTFSAGNGPGGGYRVRACLPVIA